jgi:hypothetical protein
MAVGNDTIACLQRWYQSQCNGDWEHSDGIRIATLDNPGWTVDIDLNDTILENKTFQLKSYGVGKDAGTSGDEWLDCKVEHGVFKGRGGPFKLQEMIEIFLDWAQKNS